MDSVRDEHVVLPVGRRYLGRLAAIALGTGLLGCAVAFGLLPVASALPKGMAILALLLCPLLVARAIRLGRTPAIQVCTGMIRWQTDASRGTLRASEIREIRFERRHRADFAIVELASGDRVEVEVHLGSETDPEELASRMNALLRR